MDADVDSRDAIGREDKEGNQYIDDLNEQLVYESYRLTDEEIEIVEQTIIG